MWIFPAIDLVDGKAVRLKQGDYQQMTVYNEDPAAQAKQFEACGARYLHTVDLDGAKSGRAANIETVRRIIEKTDLLVEIGGGIRDMAVIGQYMEAGIWRVILGTATDEDPDFLKEALDAYGERIAVGVDIRGGEVRTKGWLEGSGIRCDDFCEKLQKDGVRTVICTDISKDGMMQGTNVPLYRHLTQTFPGIDFVASGGVSSLDDVRNLAQEGLYGAIIGKALYTGAVDLKEAVTAVQEEML